MLLRLLTVVSVVVCLCSAGFAQEPATAPGIGYEDSFQVGLFTNGAVGGGGGSVFFPFTNAGFHAFPAFPVTNSDICVNAYIIASSGSMASCCSCRVAPNSFTYILDAPYAYPGSDVTVKLISTLPANPSRTPSGQAPSQCSPLISPSPSDLGVPLGYASGMRAWTESQSDLNYPFYEKAPFSPAPLGATELSNLTQQCGTASQCTCLPAAFTEGAASSQIISSRIRPFRVKSSPVASRPLLNPFGIK